VEAAGEHLRIELRSAPDRVVLELCGELDLASVPLLESELQKATQAETKTIILDLDALDFVDSSGLRSMLSARERASDNGGQLLLSRCSEQLTRLLAVAGVTDYLPTIASPDGLLV
jgi:anti-anti-sigma factor